MGNGLRKKDHRNRRAYALDKVKGGTSVRLYFIIEIEHDASDTRRDGYNCDLPAGRQGFHPDKPGLSCDLKKTIINT
jgi:hypothetical protein